MEEYDYDVSRKEHYLVKLKSSGFLFRLLPGDGDGIISGINSINIRDPEYEITHVIPENIEENK